MTEGKGNSGQRARKSKGKKAEKFRVHRGASGRGMFWFPSFRVLRGSRAPVLKRTGVG